MRIIVKVNSKEVKSKNPERFRIQDFLAPPVELDVHFDPVDQNNCSNQCLHWLQEVSTGHFHCYGFESNEANSKKYRVAFATLYFLYS